ncbi:hypothetical protein PR202_gb15525 [Eleusine coracana subsp. coracana]|uniref:Secreted protein n=1 Tax=Eleusine coracana subsp. coracana TaxID=191504 RepID=A0AAV5EZN6_ELECO|nr:hypothetical protein PR202_gb15525 [Eleusine coracana subsp. coracana]
MPRSNLLLVFQPGVALLLKLSTPLAASPRPAAWKHPEWSGLAFTRVDGVFGSRLVDLVMVLGYLLEMLLPSNCHKD